MSTIVVDATGLDSGHRTRGIGRYVQGLVQGLAELVPPGGPLRIELLRLADRKAGGEAPAFREVEFARRTAKDAFWMFLENRVRLGELLRGRADLYHATGMEGVVTGLPWVATCHDLIPLDLRGPYLRPWDLEAQVFWRAYVHRLRHGPRRIIAISQFVRQRLIEAYGVPAQNVDVVYHGVAPFWHEPAGAPSQAVQAVAERPFLLFVGGFDARKNMAGTLEALSSMDPRVRPRLVVAGARTPVIKRRHNRLLRRHPVDVTFLEYVDDEALRWLYSRAVALAFPSTAEGWGFPIVEAMAAGCPVICAGFGSMVESGGGAAHTVDIHSPRAIAQAVAELSASVSLQSERRAAGRERAATLTWRACAEGVLETYSAALRG